MKTNFNLFQEQLIPLVEAYKYLPYRNGKRTHYSTIFRWVSKGARGRVLESVLLGGMRYTSVEALQRFTSTAPAVVDLRTADAISEALADDGV